VPCEATTMAALHSALRGRPGYVDVWGPLERRKAAEPNAPLYYRLDTHWDGRGQGVAARALLDSLAPGRWESTALHLASDRHSGDLTALLGRPATERTVSASVTRPGVDVRADATGSRATSTGPWLLPGRTVIVGDSFAESIRSSLDPYLTDVTYVGWHDLSTPRGRAALAAADTLVVEVVERSLANEAALGLHRFARVIKPRSENTR